MRVRNFYVNCEIDNRATALTGGPATKNGGLYLTLYQRSDNEVVTAIKINCYEKNGKLITRVMNNEKVIYTFESER